MRAKSRLSIVETGKQAGLSFKRNARLSWDNVRDIPTGPYAQGRKGAVILYVAIIDRFKAIGGRVCVYAYMCLVRLPEAWVRTGGMVGILAESRYEEQARTLWE